MKAKLNLTIAPEVLEMAKQYASDHDTSISSIVEEYLEFISKPKKKVSLVEYIDSLPKSEMFQGDIDFKKEYYEAKGKKYGF